MKPKINTFIFDCFNVICDPVISNWNKGNRIDKGFIDENLSKILEMFDLGKLSEDELLNYFSEYDDIKYTKKEIRDQIDGYLNINNELTSIIKNLKFKGFKIILLSNGNASFFERKIYPIYPEFKDLFDEIIISSKVGMIKPNKDIYEYTLNLSSIKPEEALFIDDRKINVDTATRLGINGLVYSDNESFIDYLKGINVELT